MSSENTLSILEIAGESLAENVTTLPYVMHIRNAYKFLCNTRMTVFLKSLDFSLNELSPQSKDRFDFYINSKMGKEKLAEYSDTILRTSSKTCIAALGILYADSLYNKLFSEEMKRIACFAFQGATQPLVDSFVVLCDLRPEVTDPPYPLCILSEKEFKSNATLRKAIGTPEDAFACIHELIRKGFFLPDHTHYRIAKAGWHIVYGVTETSIKLKHLLSEANRYIKTCDV